jgi:hypothetical protein
MVWSISANDHASTSDRHQVRWQLPQRGRVKCNINASFSEPLNKIVISICIRHEEDIFVLAKTTSVFPMCSVPVGESLCLFKALEWLSDMFFYNVDFVLDSKVCLQINVDVS